MSGRRRWPFDAALARMALVCVVLAVAILAPALAGAAETDSPGLARLLPESVGLWVELENLDRDLDAFERGELARRLEAYPAFAQWAAANDAELDRMTAQLQATLGVSVDELLKKVFGKRAGMAIWPKPQGAMHPPAVLLVEAADSAALQHSLERLVATQRESGRADAPVAFRAANVEFDVYRLRSGDNDLFVCVAGDVGVVANDEPALQDILRRKASGSADGSLAELPAFRKALASGLTHATLRAVLNSRAWDDQVRAEVLGHADAANGFAAGWQAWQAIEFAVGSIELGDTLRAEAVVGWDQEKLPAEVREFSLGGAGSARFLRHVPAHAFFAAAGRFDLARVAERLGMAQASAGKGQTKPLTSFPGWSAFENVLKNLGPEAGAFLAPSSPATANANRPAWQRLVPIDWAAAIDVAATGDERTRHAAGRRIDALLRSSIGLGVAVLNLEADRDVASVETVDVEGSTITSVRVEGPLGTDESIAYGIVDGRLWLCPSRDAVLRAARLVPADSLAESAGFRRLQSPTGGEPGHVLYVHFAGLRTLLKDAPQIGGLVVAGAAGRSDVQRNWQELESLLELADALLFTASIDKQGAKFSAALVAEKAPAADEPPPAEPPPAE